MIAEFVQKHDKKVHRILEIMPGLLTWLFILSPLWLGLIYPPAIIYLLTLLTVYWSYLAITGTVGGFLGYRRYKKEMAMNWMDEVNKLNFDDLADPETRPQSLNELNHFVLIPAVNEPYDVLKPSIDSLFNQSFPVDKTTLVFTLEEKYADETKQRILDIIGDRKNRLKELLIYVHPAGIEGEAIGVAGANRTWGAKHAVEHLKNSGENLRNYIFTTIDCDHVINYQYMARLTHLYLTSDKRDNRFYSSAVYTFNNNNWDVPTLMRIEANFVTLGTLSDWGLVGKGAKTKDNFAAYSTSLKTLIDADYWDPTLGIDDTIYYWRAFFARDGDYIGTQHYIPFSADAVKGKTYLGSYRSLYKQLLRWGYGVIDWPLSIKGFMTNKRVPMGRKIAWVFKHLRKRVILINMVFLITFGFAMTTIINPDIKQTSFAYSLPDTMSVILSFTMIFLIPGFIIRSKISPMPKNWSLWKKAIVILEGPLVIVNLLTYSFIPYVDAQTRMMLGKKMKDHYHTPKVRG